ncbi:hypothetical protein J6590_049994 [Homalodisca vitripennis]|nr:hypothetical protein J6590_049994 [Homalodisca vitripennis]
MYRPLRILLHYSQVKYIEKTNSVTSHNRGRTIHYTSSGSVGTRSPRHQTVTRTVPAFLYLPQVVTDLEERRGTPGMHEEVDRVQGLPPSGVPMGRDVYDELKVSAAKARRRRSILREDGGRAIPSTPALPCHICYGHALAS